MNLCDFVRMRALAVLLLLVEYVFGTTDVRWARAVLYYESALQSRAVDTSATFKILEGQPIGTVVGTIPTKPNFTYRFNENIPEFNLNSTTGIITTSKILDRESFPSDKFDIVVLSSQPTYPIEVRIQVIDINDNSPSFPDASIEVRFSESAIKGTRVILDTATDGDIGENDVATYKIVSGNEDGNFELGVTTNPSGETPYLHLETTGKLDREDKAYYQLNISAEDGGTPKNYGYLLLNITILDVNDNPPIFDHSDYIVSLNESVPIGTFVLTVVASDNDINDNSKITYYLSETESQFAVDPVTGEISTMEPLNCPQNCHQISDCAKSCVFTVFARDHGIPRQDGRTYVTVNLIDANDHDPIINFRYFPKTASFATVDENAQNGSVVAAVSVVDNDEGLNGESVVKIEAGNNEGHFRLVPHSQNGLYLVHVNGVLDREKINKYNLTLTAIDKGSPSRSSIAFLIIHVNDINDHEPVFERSEYSAVLSELAPIGTYVAGITATDEDTGINSNIYYKIESGNENQWFNIDDRTGLVTTKMQLDREIQGRGELKIKASDGGPNTKSAHTYLKFQILDENDEVPQFAQKIVNVTLSESAPPNTEVAIISAVDNDQGTNGSVSYSFHINVEQHYPGIFLLDSSSGRVSTKTKLDREMMPEFVINVIAKDQGAPPLSSTATINLKVLDVNDNSPEFYPAQYFTTIEENLPIGSSVIRVSATDKDEGLNAKIKYSLHEGSNGVFEIDESSGIIKLRGRLSRHQKPQYTLKIAAKDSGNRKALEDATIFIIIESNKVKILEFNNANGYLFNVVEGSERKELSRSQDIGRVEILPKQTTGPVKYSILSGDPEKVFKLNEDTGVLYTSKRVDREERANYKLQVLASSGIDYGKTFVNISVEDINDNSPYFPEKRAVAHVKENWPIGHEVYLSKAEDYDSGDNSKLSYSLTLNPGNYFIISRSTGMIYLNKHVTHGAGTDFNMEVTATDNGNPPLKSRQYVTIVVDDVNDHTPVFQHSSYETSLLESAGVNSRFFALTATDKDTGKNGHITYDITEGNSANNFGIFPDGYLYVKNKLDRDKIDYYALEITASDHGEPRRFSKVSMVIHIIDENDNAPVFKNETFKFYIYENEPPDTYIGKLFATDKDKGRNAEMTYSLSTNQFDFIVNPKSGIVKSLKYFDREALVEKTGSNFISLDAKVTDNGVTRLSDKAEVIIYVTDVNDNAPEFQRTPYITQITEGAPLNTQVIRVFATDADEGLNGDVIYRIVSGNDDERFKIDESTGAVLVKKVLDRESMPEYELIIAAQDAGESSLTTTTSLLITVLDENDNSPEFSQTESQITLSEVTPTGKELIQFQATDTDTGINQEVTFSITGGNVHETFTIDKTSGILKLEKPLDYEQIKVYKLNITASDNGTPKLSSTIFFKVDILDFNDNPPNFSQTDIVRQIKEGIPVNKPIVTVTAEDPDSGSNGIIRYSITEQEPKGKHFGINSDTGVIFTLKPIDREFTNLFRLTVVATDQAVPENNRLSAEKLVTVIVEDVNDNAPHFVSLNAGVVRKDSDRGTVLITLDAKDEDADTNGLVTYDLLEGNQDLFFLDRTSGEIYLNRKISTPPALHTIRVKATDEAVQSQRKSTETRVTFIVVTEENNGPTFLQPNYSGSIYENEPIGSSVITVSASYLNSKVEYYITKIFATDEHGNKVETTRLFSIDKTNGVIQTAEVLDRESGVHVYEIEVYAVVTSGIQPKTANVKVSH